VNKQPSTTTISIGCGPILLLFIILKLCGVITWSWWWVFWPLWLPFAILIIAPMLVVGWLLLVSFLALLLEKR
jgi:hypothetical protein